MVRLVLLLLLLPNLAYGAFSARVDRAQVPVGGVIVLTLSLEGAKAQGEPNLEPVQREFEVASLGSGSQMSIVNGKISRSRDWNYRLSPRRAGQLLILPIDIATNAGTQTTQAVTVSVADARVPAPAQAAGAELVKVEASISSDAPYVRENLIYTVVITSFVRMRDAGLDTPNPEQTVFEQIGKAEEHETVIAGRPAIVTTVRYRLTPLTSGELLLPPAVFEARVLDPNARRRFDPFGSTGYRPVQVLSNSLTLQVKAAQSEPWLPLSALHIEERWDPQQTFRVGEPISRELALVADGSDGAQLPEFVFLDEQAFRLYLDRPEFETVVDRETDTVRGTRREHLTLIPRHPGLLELPEIRVSWWDVNRDEAAWAEFPARQIEVLPALAAPGQPSGSQGPVTVPGSGMISSPLESSGVDGEALNKSPAWLWFLAGFASGFLVLAGAWWIRSGRASSSVALFDESAEHLSRKAARREFRGVSAPAELTRHLQRYATQFWDTPKAASPRLIAERAGERFEVEAAAELLLLLTQLERAQYGQTGEFDGLAWGQLMQAWLLQQDSDSLVSTQKSDPLGALNPGIN